LLLLFLLFLLFLFFSFSLPLLVPVSVSSLRSLSLFSFFLCSLLSTNRSLITYHLIHYSLLLSYSVSALIFIHFLKEIKPYQSILYRECISSGASLMQEALAFPAYPVINTQTLFQYSANHIECHLSDRKRRSK
jgi:hypothetical protein